MLRRAVRFGRGRGRGRGRGSFELQAASCKLQAASKKNFYAVALVVKFFCWSLPASDFSK
jgi:hypothetical protein